MKVAALDHTLGYDPERRDPVHSVDERLAVAARLDRLGIDYIEGGCPAADRAAREFFARALETGSLRHAQLVASTRLDAVHDSLETDAGIQSLLAAGTPAVVLSGCCWDAGPVGLQRYCRRAGDAVRYLKMQHRFVIFRAGDFFDGYGTDPPFALRLLEAAKEGGADVLCLCDSAGGTLPRVIREVCLEVRKRFAGVLGIRALDDAGLAVANTLEAVEQGFTHVEGSLGVRRGGSASLQAIIANLEYKLGHTVVEPKSLEDLPAAARFLAEAGATPLRREPPPDPQTLLDAAEESLRAQLRGFERHAVMDRIALLESMGYQLQTAGGTLELLVRETLHPDLRPFEPERYELTSHSSLYGAALSAATVTVLVGQAVRSDSEQGAGPVDALERALRQCLFALYPAIGGLHVRDYAVRVIDPAQGGLSRVRAAIEWSEGEARWTTAAVSEDLTEALWLALVDGFRLALMRLADHGDAVLPPTTDSSWAV